MNKVYLLLGSNLANPQKQLRIATELLSGLGVIEDQSSIYLTAAWGNPHQPDFLNQVIVIKSGLNATELLKRILDIEHAMGRIRSNKNAPRKIDIDILFFNEDIIEQNDLIVPHPALPFRRFALEPLNELTPRLFHPTLKKTVEELLSECTDRLNVKRI